ncbi:anaerobic ribonucleoside-triphosphate reductase activating protein [Actinomycetota bacterium]|nr:anaerobic ribonucleoside-triphosphate reductase activating protein [Actinomycetota bacterium]
MINIAGMSKLSTVDWPGNLVTTLFLQGCPWRCNYCHNFEILDPKVQGEVDFENEVLPHLASRVGLLDGVVFSGGEPTMQTDDLAAAIDKVKEFKNPMRKDQPAFKIGLHTGGAYPKTLQRILHDVDWIGFDIKAPLGLYDKITNILGSEQIATHSLGMILEEQEFRKNTDRPLSITFRTTVDQTVMSEDDVKRLQSQLKEKGIDNLVLQEVRTLGAPEDYATKLKEALDNQNRNN